MKTGIDDKIKILGVLFSSSQEASIIIENWESKIRKMESMVLAWKRRNLSIIGRICVVKSLIAAQVTHLLSSLTPPDTVVKKINSTLFKFIWGKIEKVKRTELRLDHHLGGLKMFDLETFHKKMLCKWTFASLFKCILNKFLPDLAILKLNTSFENVLSYIPNAKKLPVFYIDMLSAWYDCKTVDRDLKTTDVCWLNENIRYKGKMLWFDSWAKREMLYVDDIVRNGNVVPENELRINSGALPDFLLKFHLIKNVFRMLKWQTAKRIEGTCNVKINRTLVQYCNAQNIVNWLADERHIHSQTNRLKEQYWDNTFPNQIIDWQYIWSLPFILKLDVKCCELH